MKRLLFIMIASLFFIGCSNGYKMPDGFETDLRELYVKWYEERDEIFGPLPYLTTEQNLEIWQQDSVIRQKYRLLEQAKEAGYFKEEQQVFDTIQMDLSQYQEYMEGWTKRNTTPEFQSFVENMNYNTKIDEIIANDKLLPIEKLILVSIRIHTLQ